MKRVFLLIVVQALLVVMGFAQGPAASGNAEQINIKGCVSGSDGNYTVLQNNTGKTFKIITSSTDLKAYVGQDVNLTGRKAGTPENGIAVTDLNMISVHCAAIAAAPVAGVSAPSERISTPPAADAPAAAVSTPVDAAEAAAAPDAAVPDANAISAQETVVERPAPPAPAAVAMPSETIGTPPAPAAAPTTPVNTLAENASAPAAAAAVHRTRPSARSPKPAATPDAPDSAVSKPVVDAAVPATTVGPPSDTAGTPVTPAKTTFTIKTAGMMISVVLVVLLIGVAVPLYNRWRKRKLLEQTRGQNLSFTKESKSDSSKSDTTGGRKAA